MAGCEGHIATPLGEIHGAFDFEAGLVSVRAPTGARYRVGISKTARRLASIDLNQGFERLRVWPQSQSRISRDETDEHVYFNDLEGDASFTLVFADELTQAPEPAGFTFPGPMPPFPPATYPATFQGADSFTQGMCMYVLALALVPTSH